MTDASGLPYRPCVGVMLLNGEDRVFVGRRSDRGSEPEGPGNWWQMPQGGMNEGESPEAAARRELREETGVESARFLARTADWLIYDLPAALVGIAWEGRYRGQKQMWFAARFEGMDREIDISPRPGHDAEFDAWRWVPMEELPALVVPFKRNVYAQVVRGFEPLLRAR
ncbi:MAG: RNA pyrophosphohydrolase [Methyloceanibacter sp.]